MAREFSRRVRVAEEIKKELGILIETKVKDPGVRFASVTDVDVSPDLKHAKVYIGVFDIVSEKDTAPEVMAALERAKGFLRSQLSKRLRMRKLPELRFFHDVSERDAHRLSHIIDQALAADEGSQTDDDSSEP